jgi:myo-inositol-1(or 4)-monophosphatase
MLNTAISIVKQAGVILSSYYGAKEVRYKQGIDGRKSTITKADTESEELITKLIKEKFPTHGIYGEEGVRENIAKEYVWYIDPLDGTTNFSRSIPFFGISLGLAYKNKPILGVLLFPELNLLLEAEKEKGARANKNAIQVSNRQLSESLYYISAAEARDGWTFSSLKNKVGWVRAMDVSSFEFASIAMGNSELYTFTKSPHDMVAGAIIIKEAGGRVSDENGNDWNTNSNYIIASNKIVHNEVLNIISKDIGMH